MNTRKILFGLLTGAMLCGMTAVVNAEESFDYTHSESSSESRTVTDAMGNEYEVTHVIETVNGETEEWYKGIPFVIQNDTENDVVAFYLANATAEEWGDEIFTALGDGSPLESGTTSYGLNLSYNVERPLFDIKFEMADGTEVPFNSLDMSTVLDADSIKIILKTDEETGEYILDTEFTEKNEVAEELNWSDVEDEAASDVHFADASYVDEERIGLKFLLPDSMQEEQLSDESLNDGYLRFFTEEEENLSLSILLREDESVQDVRDYKKQLDEDDNLVTELMSINGIPCVAYATSQDFAEENAVDDITTTIAFVGEEGGSIIQFDFTATEEEGEAAEMAKIIIASIQLIEE